MLRATTMRGGQALPDHLALNDVVITKAARARMTDLSVSVGDEFVTRVKADGLIVATPTGSTAYNLAAGGPIVQPVVDAIVLTPIAPHMLTNRPIVIPGRVARARAADDGRARRVFVTFDGQAGYQLEAGDEVRIRCADRRVRLLRPSTRSYFEVLRQKAEMGRAVGRCVSWMRLSLSVAKILHLIFLHVAVVLVERPRELVRAVVAAHEIQKVGVGRVHRRVERRAAGRRDRSGRQARIPVRVVRRIEREVVARRLPV